MRRVAFFNRLWPRARPARARCTSATSRGASEDARVRARKRSISHRKGGRAAREQDQEIRWLEGRERTSSIDKKSQRSTAVSAILDSRQGNARETRETSHRRNFGNNEMSVSGPLSSSWRDSDNETSRARRRYLYAFASGEIREGG